MSDKPILLLTHSRSCSTAFERVFMTSHSTIRCIHEPFGDSFYFGPEKISPAFSDNPERCSQSGHANSTYATITSTVEKVIQTHPNRRIFVKDMSYHIIPSYPHLSPTTASPSLAARCTQADVNNPSLLPWEFLNKFKITFLIRHPASSVPSKYKFTVPPLQQTTGMKQFYPREMGYRELRLMFDFLRGDGDGRDNVVVDADDLLAEPSATVRAYCEKVGVVFDERMLSWNDEEDQRRAEELFEKYSAYHVDVLDSKGLVPKAIQPRKCGQELEDEWEEKFGKESVQILRHNVESAMEDYEYLRQFKLKVGQSKP